MGAAGVMNISRPSLAARLSASLLPSEIVRIKRMQAIKIDRVVVTRRMQDHAVRRRPRLFVADIGVAHETPMVIDGSPPVGANGVEVVEFLVAVVNANKDTIADRPR